jgi:hypothetical protein|tara:strand:- start:27 stop:164 length:138 start_codon:yes stop_codon:yes gene_type:complete
VSKNLKKITNLLISNSSFLSSKVFVYIGLAAYWSAIILGTFLAIN